MNDHLNYEDKVVPIHSCTPPTLEGLLEAEINIFRCKESGQWFSLSPDSLVTKKSKQAGSIIICGSLIDGTITNLDNLPLRTSASELVEVNYNFSQQEGALTIPSRILVVHSNIPVLLTHGGTVSDFKGMRVWGPSAQKDPEESPTIPEAFLMPEKIIVGDSDPQGIMLVCRVLEGIVGRRTDQQITVPASWFGVAICSERLLTIPAGYHLNWNTDEQLAVYLELLKQLPPTWVSIGLTSDDPTDFHLSAFSLSKEGLFSGMALSKYYVDLRNAYHAKS